MMVLAVVLVVLLAIGVPIGFAFGLSGAAALWWTGMAQLNVVAKMFAGLDSFARPAAVDAVTSVYIFLVPAATASPH
jgi:hypothetical protein